MPDQATLFDVFTSGGNYTLALLGTILAGVSLMLAVAGGAVWLLFKDWAQRKLVDGAKAQFDLHLTARQRKISHLASAHALNEAALAQWAAHEQARNDADSASGPLRQAREDVARYSLDAAITLGQRAFDLVYPDHGPDTASISNLLPDDYELRFAARVASNLGFYLVTRDQGQDITLAAQRAGLIGALADRCQHAGALSWREIQESHVWIRYRTGLWDAARVSVAVRALREKPDVPQPWEARYREAGLTI